MSELYQVSALTKFYGAKAALNNVTFGVEPGRLVGLLGPNGSGKTTLLKISAGLLQATTGQVLIDGTDVATMDPVKLRRRIGYVMQAAGLLPHRTVLDNMARVLVERETIYTPEVDMLMKGASWEEVLAYMEEHDKGTPDDPFGMTSKTAAPSAPNAPSAPDAPSAPEA